MDAQAILKNAEVILVIDWPSREVPETLARSGLQVIVRGGPGPTDFFVWEWTDGEIRTRHLGRAPERAGVVYAFRPLSELPGILALARELGATAVWTQSGYSAPDVKDPEGCWVPPDDLRTAKALADAAGLKYLTEPYIADVVNDIPR